MLCAREVRVDQAELIWKALQAFRNALADFADCLIAESGRTAGCEPTMTFDREAAKLTGVTRLD